MTELHSTKPLLANVLGGVSVVKSDKGVIHISAPVTPMWDDRELKAELAGVEEVLSRLAGHAVKVVVDPTAQPAPGRSKPKPKGAAIERLRSVYDVEEL